MDAGRVAELEAAQAAAQGALLAEMDLLRRQKAAAEEQARRLETQARPTLKCALIAGVLYIQPAFKGRGNAPTSLQCKPDVPYWQHQGVERIMQVGELASVLRSSREEVAAQVAAATAKDRENSQLWEQVCSALPAALTVLH